MSPVYHDSHGKKREIRETWIVLWTKACRHSSPDAVVHVHDNEHCDLDGDTDIKCALLEGANDLGHMKAAQEKI